jgi:hypothetical protein
MATNFVSGTWQPPLSDSRMIVTEAPLGDQVAALLPRRTTAAKFVWRTSDLGARRFKEPLKNNFGNSMRSPLRASGQFEIGKLFLSGSQAY